MRKISALLAGAALLLATSSAMAVTLDPSLDRPVEIQPAYQNENSLQTELNKVFGAGKVNAASDQVPWGMYKVSTPGSDGFQPQFKFEWTANDGKQGVGIFSWNGSSTTEYLIFTGGHNAGDYADVIWDTQDSGWITSVDKTASGPVYGPSTPFSGIDRNSFGFFFQPAAGSDPTYYTVDSLNPGGEARVLAYDGGAAGIPNSGILFAYEDGNDWDFQDAGFFVESITPVPEPGTMLLLGAGFLSLAIYGKRRRNI